MGILKTNRYAALSGLHARWLFSLARLAWEEFTADPPSSAVNSWGLTAGSILERISAELRRSGFPFTEATPERGAYAGTTCALSPITVFVTLAKVQELSQIVDQFELELSCAIIGPRVDAPSELVEPIWDGVYEAMRNALSSAIGAFDLVETSPPNPAAPL